MRRRLALPTVFLPGTIPLLFLIALAGCAEKPEKTEPAEVKSGAEAEEGSGAPAVAAGKQGLVPLDLVLPKPAFVGTPKNIPLGTTVEKPTGKPRPPFLAPPGTKNVALNRPVTGSDEEPIIGELELITDGDKEAADGCYVELGPGTQYVQIDLEAVCTIYAVLSWHYHGDPRVYRDIVIQVADDPDFITGVRTIFNNDHDNSSGLGLGGEREYFETFEGKLVEAKGVRTRYIRLYSNGSTADEMNRYTEVEVYGRPAE